MLSCHGSSHIYKHWRKKPTFDIILDQPSFVWENISSPLFRIMQSHIIQNPDKPRQVVVKKENWSDSVSRQWCSCTFTSCCSLCANYLYTRLTFPVYIMYILWPFVVVSFLKTLAIVVSGAGSCGDDRSSWIDGVTCLDLINPETTYSIF